MLSSFAVACMAEMGSQPVHAWNELMEKSIEIDLSQHTAVLALGNVQGGDGSSSTVVCRVV